MAELKFPIEVKIDVPTETANACLKILEMWVNAKEGRDIRGHRVTGEYTEYYLTEKGERNESEDM